MAEIRHFRDLRVYQTARSMAKRVFDISKTWPREERYSLIDQIRRSSRSVHANIAEAWRKRRYPAHFISKLTDADAEGAETQSWLDSALDCDYIDQSLYDELNLEYEALTGGLVNMMSRPEQWCGVSKLVKEESAEYMES